MDVRFCTAEHISEINDTIIRLSFFKQTNMIFCNDKVEFTMVRFVLRFAYVNFRTTPLFYSILFKHIRHVIGVKTEIETDECEFKLKITFLKSKIFSIT